MLQPIFQKNYYRLSIASFTLFSQLLAAHPHSTIIWLSEQSSKINIQSGGSREKWWGGGIGTIENNAQPGELLRGEEEWQWCKLRRRQREQMEGNQYLNNQSLERLSMKIRVNLTTTSIVCTHDFHSFTIYLPIPPNVWSSSHYRQLFLCCLPPSSTSRDCLLFGNSKAQAVDGCPTCKWQYRSSHIAARPSCSSFGTLSSHASHIMMCASRSCWLSRAQAST